MDKKKKRWVLTSNAQILSITCPDCGSALSIIGNLKDDSKAIDKTWVVTHQLANHILTCGDGSITTVF